MLPLACNVLPEELLLVSTALLSYALIRSFKAEIQSTFYSSQIVRDRARDAKCKNKQPFVSNRPYAIAGALVESQPPDEV